MSLCLRLTIVFWSLLSLAFAQTIRIDITHPTNSFVPNQALGAGIDRIPAAAAAHFFNQPALPQILAAGWQPVTYRQNTELHVEAWHWNPEGSWSDSAFSQGYFTGSPAPGDNPIRHSYGYPLPHRGFTRNEGTETLGYSRLTDGDLDTYWKSNPYLTKAFTGEDDALHPQWVVVDFATPQPVDALRIAWGEPYARQYVVQYWSGEDAMKLPAKGKWVTFRNGEFSNGKGGNETLQLDSHPQDVRYLRIWMTASSNTCDTHGSADLRNCVGYAIRELYVGLADSNGFHDTVRHTPDQDQTATFCSSVDPWHRAGDIGSSLHEQVGLDAFYQSGYTRGLPAMVPVSILYGIPEDSANEVAYLEKHGYLISYVEIGEEPDGQYMLPEDYGALYLQWATALHKVDPALKLGGPVFTGQNEDILVWRDAKGKMSWTGRFLDYLKSHGRMQDLAFFSFEHYPYEPCKISWNNLYDEPELMRHILQVWRKDGLPEDVPMFVTESNITWNAGESSLDIFGALWLADYVGSFFTAGGNALYYFHYLPLGVERGCNDSGGTFGMFTVDRNYDIQQATSQFFASQLITTEWVQPGSTANQIYAAEANIEDSVGHSLVTAYALLRPDGLWSLMVVNRDQENAHHARISFEKGRGAPQFFSGTADVLTFDRARYVWHPEPLPYQPFAEKTVGGFASPSQSFGHIKINPSPYTIYDLPAASVTVIRGKIGFAQE